MNFNDLKNRLSEKQKERLTSRLIETTSYREMEMHYHVDEKIIGGLIIRIGDRVVDSSIKTQLDNMEKDLLRIRL